MSSFTSFILACTYDDNVESLIFKPEEKTPKNKTLS